MNTVLLHLRNFAAEPSRRRASYIALLLLVGLIDYAASSRTARSFEFVSLKDGKPIVERRFIPRTFSREEAIGRYVAEYLLGPADVEAAYLFDKNAALRSVIVRNGVANVDLSGDAAFPPLSGLDVRASMNILITGIKRNFPSIKHAKVYIEGHEPYAVPLSENPLKESASKKGKSVDK
jgi:hypothetical protein